MAALDHLLVNGFLKSELDARAVKAGFELGLLDRLAERGPATLESLSRELRINPTGFDALVSMLETNAVIARLGDSIGLTDDFVRALRFRDLMEVRIDFADFVWPDIHRLFTPLLNDVQLFTARSRTFDLFRYDRCLNVTDENLAAARVWTRFTSCLTKYESSAALDAVDLASVRTFVDLGGNTGEFALRVCRRHEGVPRGRRRPAGRLRTRTAAYRGDGAGLRGRPHRLPPGGHARGPSARPGRPRRLQVDPA